MIVEIAREREMTCREVAKRAKINEAQIYKWKMGAWTGIPDKTFDRVLDVVAETPEDRAALVAAYAMDMLTPKAEACVTILPRNPKAGPVDKSGLSGRWNAELRRKLELIGNAVLKDEEFRRMFETMAGWSKRLDEL